MTTKTIGKTHEVKVYVDPKFAHQHVYYTEEGEKLVSSHYSVWGHSADDLHGHDISYRPLRWLKPTGWEPDHTHEVMENDDTNA